MPTLRLYCKMARGLYSKKLSFYRDSLTPDGEGGRSKTQVLYKDRFAKVSLITNVDTLEGLQVGSNQAFKIIVDSRDFDLKFTDKIHYGEKILSILSISNKSERNREFEIIAVVHNPITQKCLI